MIYLDNAATTRCDPEVAQEMIRIYTQAYGNPSSAHGFGLDAERIVRDSAETIAKTLKCKRQEIIFTSGGTESDNLAIRGAAYAMKRRGNHLITSAIEHPAVKNVFPALEKEGFRVTVLPVDRQGMVDLSALEEAICEDTILVSIMHVNNEVGSVQPLKEAGEIIKKHGRHILFHTDAVQGYGKRPLKMNEISADLLSASAHKFHGPKGCGFLYVREGVRLFPQILGGGQQKGIRSGTENVPGIAGMALAAKKAHEDLDKNAKKMYDLKALLKTELRETLSDVAFNGPEDTKSAPHILSVTAKGVKAEVLLHALEEKGICVSAGSACAVHHPGSSDTLKAIGLGEDESDATIRISLSKETTKEEIMETAGAMGETVPLLRKFTKR